MDALRPLDREQEVQWMLVLGAQLTVCARCSYPLEETPGNITMLIGFNEMQHRVYGRIRQLHRGEEWTLESFLEGLLQQARYYQIEGDFGAALKASMGWLA
jgi:hypothetical protein